MVRRLAWAVLVPRVLVPRVLVPGVLMAAGQAAAQTRPMEALGTKLVIDSPCAKSVSIEPDAALTGKITVEAAAAHPEELAQLVLESTGDAVKLHAQADSCWKPGMTWSFEPTLTLAVHVPAGTALSVDESGGASYTIGAVGAFAVDVSGGMDMHVARTGALSLDASGGVRLNIGEVDGPIQGDISGGGVIAIGSTSAPALALDVSGGGRVHIGDGNIGTAKIDISGGGHADIGGLVGTANVEVSGAGTVNFGRAPGNLQKDVSGAGSVTIGGQ